MQSIQFPPEPQNGPIEYKLKLINIDKNKLEKLTAQMQWRLNEGKGFTIYFLGLSDNGTAIGLNNTIMKESQDNLYKMVNNLQNNCTIHLLNTYIGINGEIRQYFIKQKNTYEELKYDYDINIRRVSC